MNLNNHEPHKFLIHFCEIKRQKIKNLNFTDSSNKFLEFVSQ